MPANAVSSAGSVFRRPSCRRWSISRRRAIVNAQPRKSDRPPRMSRSHARSLPRPRSRGRRPVRGHGCAGSAGAAAADLRTTERQPSAGLPLLRRGPRRVALLRHGRIIDLCAARLHRSPILPIQSVMSPASLRRSPGAVTRSSMFAAVSGLAITTTTGFPSLAPGRLAASVAAVEREGRRKLVEGCGLLERVSGLRGEVAAAASVLGEEALGRR